MEFFGFLIKSSFSSTNESKPLLNIVLTTYGISLSNAGDKSVLWYAFELVTLKTSPMINSFQSESVKFITITP